MPSALQAGHLETKPELDRLDYLLNFRIADFRVTPPDEIDQLLRERPIDSPSQNGELKFLQSFETVTRTLDRRLAIVKCE